MQGHIMTEPTSRTPTGCPAPATRAAPAPGAADQATSVMPGRSNSPSKAASMPSAGQASRNESPVDESRFSNAAIADSAPPSSRPNTTTAARCPGEGCTGGRYPAPPNSAPTSPTMFRTTITCMVLDKGSDSAKVKSDLKDKLAQMVADGGPMASLVSRAGNSLKICVESLEDLVGCLGPGEGSGVLVPGFDPVADVFLECWQGFVHASA